MGFYACRTDAIGALERQWQEHLSRSSDLNDVLPLLYPEKQAISNYQSRLNLFKETQGTSGLGVLQYLNLRLEQAVTNYAKGESNSTERLSDIADVLDESAFHTLSDGVPTEPVISISMIPQFNKYVKNITMSDAELLILDAQVIHHWKRSVKGALVILREFCPEALNALSGRHIKIIPVVSPRPNLSLSASNEFVSATITASWVTPKECAEMLLHEMGHSLLADILSTTELLSASAAGLYYSPFREDARPIDGLFHAAYSFHNVCIYKFALAQNAKNRLASWARRTLESDLLRSLVCVRVLLESRDLTESGNLLVKKIDDDLIEIARRLYWDRDSKAISMLRTHFSAWCGCNERQPKHLRDSFSRIIDEVIEELTVSERDYGLHSEGKNYDKEDKEYVSRSIEFDSKFDFWRFGFPSRVSVLRGMAPPIGQTIAADIAAHGSLLVPVIEKESYKGKATDPRRMAPLREAFDRTSDKYFLFLRNFERISSSARELEEFILGQDFALGSTEYHLFCNNAGMTVPLHTDSTNNLHFVFSGKKTFFIADSNVSMESEEEGYQDGFSDFKPFENPELAVELGEFLTVSAGDVLFIPPERWHSVHYHESSISVSIFDEIYSCLAVTQST